MGAFQGRDDAFGAAQEEESVQRFLVGDSLVVDAADIFKMGVFGSDAGII